MIKDAELQKERLQMRKNRAKREQKLKEQQAQMAEAILKKNKTTQSNAMYSYAREAQAKMLQKTNEEKIAVKQW